MYVEYIDIDEIILESAALDFDSDSPPFDPMESPEPITEAQAPWFFANQAI